MNGNEYILTFADIPDDIIHSASDDAAVRKIFRQHRSHRNKMLSIMCCCIVVAAAAIGFGSQGWFGKRPPVTPGGFVTRESTTVSDDSITEQTQNRRATVEERSTEPAKETESRVSKTEDHTRTAPAVNPTRQEPTTKLSQTDVHATTKSLLTNVPPTTKARETSTTSSEIPSDIVTQPIQHGDYAAMIKVVDTVYIDTYKQYDGEIDESRMKRSVSYTDGYPRNDGEQNFSRENVDYVMISSDTLICRINGEWIVFRRYA